MPAAVACGRAPLPVSGISAHTLPCSSSPRAAREVCLACRVASCAAASCSARRSRRRARSPDSLPPCRALCQSTDGHLQPCTTNQHYITWVDRRGWAYLRIEQCLLLLLRQRLALLQRCLQRLDVSMQALLTPTTCSKLSFQRTSYFASRCWERCWGQRWGRCWGRRGGLWPRRWLGLRLDRLWAVGLQGLWWAGGGGHECGPLGHHSRCNVCIWVGLALVVLQAGNLELSVTSTSYQRVSNLSLERDLVASKL